MQKFINKPEDLTSELLEGLALANADLISLEQGNLRYKRRQCKCKNLSTNLKI